MITLNAVLTKEELLMIAVRVVREKLPLKKKMVMAKETFDLEGELACASVLLRPLGSMHKHGAIPYENRLTDAIDRAKDILKAADPAYENLKGFEVSLATAHIATTIL